MCLLHHSIPDVFEWRFCSSRWAPGLCATQFNQQLTLCCAVLLQIISCAAAPITADEVNTKSGAQMLCTGLAHALKSQQRWFSVGNSQLNVFGAADAADAGAFDFKTYMTSTAEQVNAALDAACPQKYPETLNDSMR